MRVLFCCLLAYFVLGLSCLRAQMDLPCARVLTGLGQDSLVWNPLSPCPNFEGYVIFGGPNPQNLQALDTVLDPQRGGQALRNQNEGLRYYRIGRLCQAQLQDLSGMVSNARPQTPNFQHINIVNDQPFLRWNASASPEVYAYQLYREMPYNSGNFFPYPAANQYVFDTFFLDRNAGSEPRVRYALVAVSVCNKSLLGEGTALDGSTGPHTSMFVESELSLCERSLRLTWNPYENWAQGVAYYRLEGQLNGGPWRVLDSIPANRSNYVLGDLLDGQTWAWRLVAVERGREDNTATSNTLRQTLALNREVDFIRFEALRYESDGRLDLLWDWDDEADFVHADLEYRPADSSLGTQVLTRITDFNQRRLVLSEAQAYTQGQFRLKTLDACGLNRSSSWVGPLNLKAETSEGYVNRLTWTWPFWEGLEEVVFFRLYRFSQADTVVVRSFGPLDRSFEEILRLEPREANLCYFLEAYLGVRDEFGVLRQAYVRGLPVCLNQEVVLLLPNAFTPQGANPIFRPVVVFGQNLTQYRLEIYDRYGRRIFESEDWQRGWNGLINGQMAPQGVYVYRLVYRSETGQSEELKGSLMLLH